MPSNVILVWWWCTINLTLSAQVETVSAPPGSTTWTTNGLSVTISFAKTTWAFASRCKTTHFTMFMDSFADPVDLCITTNGVMGDVNKDDFKVFVWRILGNPVWVQDSQTAETTTNTFLFRREKLNIILFIVTSTWGRCQFDREKKTISI